MGVVGKIKLSGDRKAFEFSGLLKFRKEIVTKANRGPRIHRASAYW